MLVLRDKIIIDNAKEESYQVTINNIEKNAGNYVLEDNTLIPWINGDGGNYQYQCVTVQNLIDDGGSLVTSNSIVISKIDRTGPNINDSESGLDVSSILLSDLEVSIGGKLLTGGLTLNKVDDNNSTYINISKTGYRGVLRQSGSVLEELVYG